MFNLNFFSGDKEKLKLVLEVGTTTVNSALVRYEKGSAEIIKAHKTKPVILDNAHLNSIWANLKRELVETVDNVLPVKHLKNIDEAVVVFSAPWYFSEIKKITVERAKPFFIDKKFISEILDGEMNIFSSKVGAEFVNSRAFVLEPEILKTAANGYAVPDIYKKESKNLDLFVYFSAIFEDAMNDIEQIVENKFNRSIKFSTIPAVMHRTLGRIFEKIDGFSVVDIGGEITEVFVIKKGCLVSSGSFAYGANTIIRKVASLPGMTYKDAVEKIIFGKDVTKTTEIKSIIEKSQKEWAVALDGFIKKITSQDPESSESNQGEANKTESSEKFLPSTVFVVGGGSVFKGFEDAIKEIQSSGYTLFSKNFSVNPIKPEALGSIIKNSSEILGYGSSEKSSDHAGREGLHTTPLMLAIIFAGDF